MSSRWALVSSVKASDQAWSQLLGTSVSVSGYTVVAGASGDDEGAPDGGAVYVFSPRGCDTSQPPTSGTVGSCNATLAIGSIHCQPQGTVSGSPSSCSFGTLTAATCEPNPCDRLLLPPTAASATARAARGTAVTADGQTAAIPGTRYRGHLLLQRRGTDSGNVLCRVRATRPTAPANGVVGDCTSSNPSGSTCQPTCDTGYEVSGPRRAALGH